MASPPQIPGFNTAPALLASLENSSRPPDWVRNRWGSPRRAGTDHMVDDLEKGRGKESSLFSLGSELLELGLLGAWRRHEADPPLLTGGLHGLLSTSPCPPLLVQGCRTRDRRKRESVCKRETHRGRVHEAGVTWACWRGASGWAWGRGEVVFGSRRAAVATQAWGT